MLKADLSGRAFADAQPPFKIGFLKRCRITAGGFQADWAIRHGLPNEIWNIELVGIACGLYFLLWTASVTTILHVIFDFDRPFNPALILTALLIALVQAVTDHITLVKQKVRVMGEALLRTAAIKLPSAASSSRVPGAVYVTRPVQGFSFAAMGAVFWLLAALSPGIHANLWSDFQRNNPALFAQAARVEDEQKARDTADLAVETGEANSLTRTIASLRPGMIRNAVAARRKSRRAAANPEATVEELRKQLAEAESKRASLRDAVARDDADRNSFIEKFVSSSPEAVPRRTDLAAQLGALWQLIKDSPLMWVVAALLLTAGCSLELGFMWVASSYPSATLCARLALESYEQLTKLARDGHGRLDVHPAEHVVQPPDVQPPRHGVSARHETTTSPPHDPVPPFMAGIVPDATTGGRAANDDTPPITAGLNGATPPKRPVGRPRKRPPDLPSSTEDGNG